MRRRLLPGLLVAATIAAGLGVAVLLPDTAVTDIAGDALYAVAAYLLVLFAAPRASVWVAAVIALGWCAAIELLQLTGVPERLGAAFWPAMLVLGTVFDGRDLVVYAVTIVVVSAVHLLVRARRARRTAAAR